MRKRIFAVVWFMVKFLICSAQTKGPHPVISIFGWNGTAIKENDKRDILCKVPAFTGTGKSITITILNGTEAMKTITEGVTPGNVVHLELTKEDVVIGRYENNGGDLKCKVVHDGQEYVENLKNIRVYFKPLSSQITVERLGDEITPDFALFTCTVSSSNPIATINWEFANIPTKPGGTMYDQNHTDLSTTSYLVLTGRDESKTLKCVPHYDKRPMSKLTQEISLGITGLPFTPVYLEAAEITSSSATIRWGDGRLEYADAYLVEYHKRSETSANKETTKKKSLTLQNLDPGTQYTLTIQASNKLGLSQKASIAFIVSDKEMSAGAIVGIIVGILVAVAVIVALVIVVRKYPHVCKRSNKWKTGSLNRGELPPLPTENANKRQSTLSTGEEMYSTAEDNTSELAYDDVSEENLPMDYDDVSMDKMPVDYDDVENKGYVRPVSSTGLKSSSGILRNKGEKYENLTGRTNHGFKNSGYESFIRDEDESLYEPLEDFDPIKIKEMMKDIMCKEASKENLKVKHNAISEKGEELHGGQFASVFKIKDNKVAKIMKKGASEKELRLFLKSVNALLKVKRHENILDCDGYCTDKKPWFVLLDYASNGSLRDYLVKKSSIGDKDMKKFAQGVRSGLLYLHSQNPQMVMLCLNAKHILLKSDLTCKLTGFGTIDDAKDWHSYCLKKKKTDTLRWLSPETLRLNMHDNKSDFWSFGLVLFEIYSKGLLPYEDIKDDFFREESKKQKLSLDFKKIPSPIQDLVRKCTKYQPDQRMNLVTMEKRFSILI